MTIEIDIRNTANGKMLILCAKDGEYECSYPHYHIDPLVLEEFKKDAIKAIKKMKDVL